MTISEIFEYLYGCIDAFEANAMNKSEFLKLINELTDKLELDFLDLVRKYPKIAKDMLNNKK